MTLSELLDSDRPDVWRILSDPAVFSTLSASSNPGRDVADLVAELYRTPISDADLVVVARSRNGCLRGLLRVRDNELSFFVDRMYWGQGYGRLMMDFFSEKAVQNSTGRFVRAVTLRSNLASIRLLEGAGFVFSGITDDRLCSGTTLKFTLRT